MVKKNGIAEEAKEFIFSRKAGARYLSLRLVGVEEEDARKILGISERELEGWRRGVRDFREMEEVGFEEIREDLLPATLYIEFARNLGMLLLRDYKIVKKSLEYPEELSRVEERYLRKIRGSYSIEQLESLGRVFSKEGVKKYEFNAYIGRLFMEGEGERR